MHAIIPGGSVWVELETRTGSNISRLPCKVPEPARDFSGRRVWCQAIRTRLPRPITQPSQTEHSSTSFLTFKTPPSLSPSLSRKKTRRVFGSEYPHILLNWPNIRSGFSRVERALSCCRSKSLQFSRTVVVDVCHDGFVSQQDKCPAKFTFNSRREASSSFIAARVRAVLLVAWFPPTLQETGSIAALWTRTRLLEIPYANSYLYNWYSFLVTTASSCKTRPSTHTILRL